MMPKTLQSLNILYKSRKKIKIQYNQVLRKCFSFVKTIGQNPSWILNIFPKIDPDLDFYYS